MPVPAGGPCEDPQRGLRSFAEATEGPKQRLRPESFADHYSQARQFYISQTPVQQKHIGDALVFELSKCEREDIRVRMLSHLQHIDADLAQTVATGLRAPLPKPAQAAVPPRQDLPTSPALSIVAKGPQGLTGRKLGLFVSDGTDAELFTALVDAADKEGAVYEVVAPVIGGVTLSDGRELAAKHKTDGGSSVLFDVVAVIPSVDGVAPLRRDQPSLDFVSDAFGHCKFIGLSEGGAQLLAAAGLAERRDAGCIDLAAAKDAAAFLKACAPLRLWERELEVDLDAAAPPASTRP